MSSTTDSEYHFQIFITLVIVFLIYVFFVAARFGVESVLRLQERLSQVSLAQQQVDYSRPIDARQSIQYPYSTHTSPRASASRRKKRYDSSSEDDHDYHERKSEKKDRIIRDLKDQVRGLQDKDREAKARAKDAKDKELKELLGKIHYDIKAPRQKGPVSSITHDKG
ncbi:unnamed protein product [Clonostachys chloroleuca]|uniref:Uncharacterized protein n=1 Tax=Clonostachys chloroleuca TaxID=1926264 RepID=A0AA35M6Z4_9HYPO|nr:unnamed protein product [Clonostachys chloroleuca]